MCQYMPHFQAKILELIIEKCLEIDVDIVVEEGGSVEIIESEMYDKTETGEIFEFEDEIQRSPFSPSTHSRFKSKDMSQDKSDVFDLADKLDGMISLLLQYIDKQFEEDDSIKDRIFFQLLRIFESRILTTHKSKYVQFVIFHICSKHPKYTVAFSEWLLELFLRPGNAPNKRHSAVMYLSSFISRMGPPNPRLIRYSKTIHF